MVCNYERSQVDFCEKILNGSARGTTINQIFTFLRGKQKEISVLIKRFGVFRVVLSRFIVSGDSGE